MTGGSGNNITLGIPLPKTPGWTRCTGTLLTKTRIRVCFLLGNRSPEFALPRGEDAAHGPSAGHARHDLPL